MKDSELRAVVLQEFYAKRRDGHIGIGAGNVPPLEVTGFDRKDLLAICGQLGEYGLIEWDGYDGNDGKPMAGVGHITAFGIDVIDGEQASPLPIHIDQSVNVHVEGQHGGVQVAGAHSSQQQSIEQNIEKLVSAINGSSVSEAEKKEAKGLLAKFLESSAARAVLGSTAEALLKHYGM